MPKVKLLGPVTYNGSIVEAGEILELPEKSAKSLVGDKIAEFINEMKPATVDVTDETGDEGTTDTPAEKNEATGENNSQEDIEKLKKALDNKYNKEPLAEKAKELGVEFPYDAKKAEIIDAVIAAGKADVLLQA